MLFYICTTKRNNNMTHFQKGLAGIAQSMCNVLSGDSIFSNDSPESLISFYTNLVMNLKSAHQKDIEEAEKLAPIISVEDDGTTYSDEDFEQK